MEKQKIKLCLSYLVAFFSVMLASEAQALSCTNNAATNKANIWILPTSLASIGGIYLNKFYTDNKFHFGWGCSVPNVSGPAHSADYVYPDLLCNDSPTNSGGTTNEDYIETGDDLTSSFAYYNKNLPVVCSLTEAPTYRSTNNTVTNISYTEGTTVNAGTVVGLAGAYKIRSNVDANNASTANDPVNPVRSVRFSKLQLVKSSNLGWTVKGVVNSFPATIFQLTNVVESVTGTPPNRKLTISGMLKFGDTPGSFGGAWVDNLQNGDGSFVTSEQMQTEFGSFNMTVFF